MIPDLTVRTRLGVVDLVPFLRRDEGDKNAQLCDWEKKPAVLALDKRGWERERIVHATGLRSDDVDAVLSGAGTIREFPPAPAETEAQKQSTVRRQRAAERVMVSGRWHHPRAPHGTLTGYKHWCCRCEPCSDVYSIHSAARRLVEAERRAAA